MYKTITSVLLILLAATWASDARTEEKASRSLARFVEGERSLQNLIEFPEADGDVMVNLRCLAVIDVTGKIPFNHCYTAENEYRPYERAVTNAARSARAVPASAEGRKWEVELYYQVLFVKQGERKGVFVLPNWGFESEDYGLAYSGPQRYKDPLAGLTGCERSGQAFPFMATIKVGGDGTTQGKVSIDEAGSVSPRRDCVDGIQAYHDASGYIPGEFEGQPIEATHIEVWGRNSELVFDRMARRSVPIPERPDIPTDPE